ncbi:hypothetical protein ACFJIW_08865 [Tahibacter sp. UC22_41]|uniref:hypothetical protein n=1 Tax=Tahibacter sp. UC22_41 TaxID=3350178 RepID=UPI0036DB803C
MKYLLPLLLLLAAPVAAAADGEAPLHVLRMDRSLTAQVVGAGESPNVPQAEVLVFDSFTGATNYLAENRSPRTFIGMPLNLSGAVGTTPAISRIVVYLAYTGATAQTYTSLRVRFAMFGSWSSGSNPVFSDVVSLSQADIPGPITLNPSTTTPINLLIDPPIALTGVNAHGITVNFQGNTGSGLVSTDNLTSLLRSGTNPVGVGANPMPSGYGYRNLIGQTNYNFAPSHASSFALANEAMALQLYATTGLGQSITDFAADPANPTPADGSFTVSATGGPSGNPVVFSVDPASAAVCTAGGTNGATIAILAAGTCTVLANQAGNATYLAAPQQSLAVEITRPLLVRDGGFESGYQPTYWEQDSTNFGTPICDLVSCGNASHTGAYWVLFSGTDTEAEAAYVQQTGYIDAGQKILRFYVWWESSVVAPPDPAAFFKVKIDGNTIFTLMPATAAAYHAGYTPVALDVSAYANGSRHDLRFEANNAATPAPTVIHLDDISIVDERIFANGFQ